jgi:predicted ABC-type exoprotein transport system permease subunit
MLPRVYAQFTRPPKFTTPERRDALDRLLRTFIDEDLEEYEMRKRRQNLRTRVVD